MESTVTLDATNDVLFALAHSKLMCQFTVAIFTHFTGTKLGS